MCRGDYKGFDPYRRLGTSYRRLQEKENLDDEFSKDLSGAPSGISWRNEEVGHSPSRMRRDLLLSTSGGLLGLTGMHGIDPARAVSVFEKKGLYVLNTRDAVSEASLSNEQVQVFPKLSSEYALLRVLPVKNTIFRTLEQNLESLSVLRYRRGTSNTIIDKAWARADQSVDTALTILVNKRNQLEPVFNPDDSAEVAKLKVDRGQKLLGDLNNDLETLKEAISRRVSFDTCSSYNRYVVSICSCCRSRLCHHDFKNITCAFQRQRSGLVTLGFLGELLVKRYPYKVPYKGKYSYLPRLLGRAQVTFRFKRGGNVLGTVKIVADGYIAPITAGNL